MKMENAEEIFHFLEEFSKRKTKTIPQELNDYLAYVARTGDPVYQWTLVKSLFKEKLLNVITDFYETSPGIDIPPYPNVDPFNYDTMKNSLLERLDSFSSAPFTVQRICELLTYPRKQYNRVDKFMRAVEKNILVVSTREPGIQRHIEPENGEPMEPIVNGSDNNSEYNVDVEMEDMSWKDNTEAHRSSEPQPSSSDTQISVDDLEARLKAKQDAPMDTQDKIVTQYESVTPPELNIGTDEQVSETKSAETNRETPNNENLTTVTEEEQKVDTPEVTEPTDKPKMDVEMKTETADSQTLLIPEIKVDDAEMTEQRLMDQGTTETSQDDLSNKEQVADESCKTSVDEELPTNIDDSSSDSNSKEETEIKHISDVQTSSEESSSSSDITDGNSNSPRTVESHADIHEESNNSDSNIEEEKLLEQEKQLEQENQADKENHADKEKLEVEEKPVDSTTIESEQAAPEVQATIEHDNYSISDVNSELPQPPIEDTKAEEPMKNPIEESLKKPETKEEHAENKAEVSGEQIENSSQK